MRVSASLAILGLALAVRARRTADAERFTAPDSCGRGRGEHGVYVAVIATIASRSPRAAGVRLAAVLGRERWRTSVIVSLAIVVALYVLFVGALDVTIPHLF